MPSRLDVQDEEKAQRHLNVRAGSLESEAHVAQLLFVHVRMTSRSEDHQR